MATKTIILRPTSWRCNRASGGYTYYPTDSATDSHLLISEEIADDDSTYILCTSNLPAGGVLFTPPDVNITPIAIRIITRMCTSVSGSTATFTFFYTSSGAAQYLDVITLSEQYETYTQNIPSDYLLNFWSNLVSLTEGDYNIGFRADTTSSDSKATKEVKLTQLYLEVDYDDGSGNTGDATAETIYLKENDSWTAISCTVYQKQSGSWNKVDTTIFENGNKFILQDMT